MNKKWLVADKITEELKSKFPEINPLVLQLLHNRQLSDQSAIDEFLNPDYGQDIHDPFLFNDMNKAVDRIFQAIDKKEKITVHGDYDADGVCASAILVTTLKELGAQVDIYIPHRVSEGYGLNVSTVRELSKNGTNLIITVDCGISSKQEVDLANEKNIDVVITDHHEQPPELPKALAIINPHIDGEKYPFKDLAGSGVAFKLAQAIIKKDNSQKLNAGFEKWLLDIVAIGTIGDMVPLVGENRTLVKYGMVVIKKTKHWGIRELVESTRFSLDQLDTIGVSFGIVPRLNAAGRIDHANMAYQLIMSKDQALAKEMSANLDKTNKERQRITEKMVKSSKEQIGEVKDERILFAIGQDWAVGVVGLVAGRLSDEYARPVLVMGEKDDEIVGSGRSIPGFDITQALMKSRDVLDRFGGHAAACGFTLKKENFEKFKDKIIELANEGINKEDMVKSYFIDLETKLKDISWELVNNLLDFEPFGEGNKQPKFLIKNLVVEDLQKVGSEGKHLRLNVQQGDHEKKIIAFGYGQDWGNQLKIGDEIDVVVEISINEWNGNQELQLRLVDIKMSD